MPRLFAVALGLIACAATPAAAPDEDAAVRALAATIDRHLADAWARAGISPAPPAADAEFLRRASLDLAGRIPRVDEVHDFLDDPDPARRARLVRELLDGPAHHNHFTNLWRQALVPQAAGNLQLQAVAAGLDPWLRRRLRQRTPYDRVVRDLIAADVGAAFGRPASGRPADSTDPAPIAFFQANEFKPENLAAATAKLFLGVDLGCAQCHNHPHDRWTRRQFWEFASFFASVPSPGRRPPNGPPPPEKVERRSLKIPE